MRLRSSSHQRPATVDATAELPPFKPESKGLPDTDSDDSRATRLLVRGVKILLLVWTAPALLVVLLATWAALLIIGGHIVVKKGAHALEQLWPGWHHHI